MSEAKTNKGVSLRLEGVRHKFTYLFEQHISKTNGNKSYRDTFLIVPESEQDKAIRAAISRAARNAWPDNAVDMVRAFQGDRTKFPYRDGSLPDGSGNVDPDLKGFWTLTGISKTQPTLKGPDNSNIETLGKNGNLLYPGAYVTGVVEIWPQLGTNAGIRCQVLGVRHDRDGAKLGGGGRKARDDEFGPPPGNPDADLVGGNPDSDDIPF